MSDKELNYNQLGLLVLDHPEKAAAYINKFYTYKELVYFLKYYRSLWKIKPCWDNISYDLKLDIAKNAPRIFFRSRSFMATVQGELREMVEEALIREEDGHLVSHMYIKSEERLLRAMKYLTHSTLNLVLQANPGLLDKITPDHLPDSIEHSRPAAKVLYEHGKDEMIAFVNHGYIKRRGKQVRDHLLKYGTEKQLQFYFHNIEWDEEVFDKICSLPPEKP